MMMMMMMMFLEEKDNIKSCLTNKLFSTTKILYDRDIAYPFEKKSWLQNTSKIKRCLSLAFT